MLVEERDDFILPQGLLLAAGGCRGGNRPPNPKRIKFLLIFYLQMDCHFDVVRRRSNIDGNLVS